MASENALAIYQKIDHPLVESTRPEVAAAVSAYTGCSLAQAPAIMLTCMCEGITLREYSRTYYPMMGKSVMKTNAMLANFRTVFGGRHEIIECSANRAAVKLIDKGGATFEYEFTLEEALSSRWPWNDFKPALAAVARLRESGINDLPSLLNELNKTSKEAPKGHVKDNWATPTDFANMMWMRAVSVAVDRFCPEVDSGANSLDEALNATVLETQITTNKPPRAAAVKGKASQPAVTAQSIAPVAPAAVPADDDAEDADFTPAEQLPAAELDPKNLTPVDSASTLAAPEPAEEFKGDGYITSGKLTHLRGLIAKIPVPYEGQQAMLATRKIKSFHSLTTAQADELIAKLESVAKEQDVSAPFQTTPQQS